MNVQAIKSISCQRLHELSRQRPIELIDVRTPEEFRDAYAAPARNVPLDTLDPQALMANRTLGNDQSLYFICQMGGRSGRACAEFMAAGFQNVVNVEGGTDAWLEAGLPVGHYP